MRNRRNSYADERDKLIPAAVARTEAQFGIEIPFSVPQAQTVAFFRHIDDLARENWLTSTKGLDIDAVAVRDFLDIHGILPARAGKIVIHCGPRSVGGVDFVGA